MPICSGEEKSLGYKKLKFAGVEDPIPNYTPPGKPTFVDVFKGDDGDDFLFKTYVMSKHTVLLSAAGVTVDATVGTQPKDLGGLLRRVGYWSVPLVGGGIAYTSFVCMAASYRNKNDRWNHVFGGIGAGIVCGGARRSILFGFLSGLAAVCVGAGYKDSVLCGFELFHPARNVKRGFAYSHFWDMSLKTEEPVNWYKDKTPMPPAAPSPQEVASLPPVLDAHY